MLCISREIRVKFVREGQRVKVKVTAARKVQNPYCRKVELPSAIVACLRAGLSLRSRIRAHVRSPARCAQPRPRDKQSVRLLVRDCIRFTSISCFRVSFALSLPNFEDFMGRQDIKRRSVTPSQHNSRRLMQTITTRQLRLLGML